MTRKLIRETFISIAIVIVGAVFILNFSPHGYRLTISQRGFTEVAPRVYIHKDATIDPADALRIIGEARERVTAFYGELRSAPAIIICDDEAMLKKLGGDRVAVTTALFKVFTHISVSAEFANVDVIAHELTHAETHLRLLRGRIGSTRVPTWFDEGVAMQNDYREGYGKAVWIDATDNGRYLPALEDFDTFAEFFDGTDDDAKRRYLISKYELEAWLDRHSIAELRSVLDSINKGASFSDVYYK